MKLPFLNRQDEKKRLKKALAEKEPILAIVYGRRRCGKSTLLNQVASNRDIYYLADMQEGSLQLSSAADQVARVIPGFNDAKYPSWDSFLSTLNSRAPANTSLFVDEFPYLAQMSPEIPSILQKFVDGRQAMNIVLCGSSQRMMYGTVLDAKAPLYGRSREILKLLPLEPGWIREAVGMKGADAFEAYATWGGIPRYWELAAEYERTREAIVDLVLDRNGVLHREAERLLVDDMRSAAQPHSLLSVIALGSNRISEIAARLGKPAVNLSRPLSILIDLGYIQRDIPFGESTKSTKRTLSKPEPMARCASASLGSWSILIIVPRL